MAKKTVISVIVALVVVIIVTPNVTTTLLTVVSSRINPLTIDLKVAVPATPSSLVFVPVRNGYTGIQSQLSGMSAIQEDIKLMPTAVDASLSIKLRQNEVSVGDNVTFTVIISWSKTPTTGLALMVFLVDSSGVVRGAYPDGKIPFLNPTNAESSLDTDTRDAMQKGRLAFTYKTDDSPLSTGKWNVYVLAARESSGNQFYTWTATSFMVVERPQLTILILSGLPAALLALGTFFGFWGYSFYLLRTPSLCIQSSSE